jgi:hypothetical protein
MESASKITQPSAAVVEYISPIVFMEVDAQSDQCQSPVPLIIPDVQPAGIVESVPVPKVSVAMVKEI